ncbi:hypothetical protein QGN29_13740 [Temperatibacter marinus]|uniref:Uncharacterized protein n=1 Tax=Temperatibacter marinus TaxID=1456591 RepID=A0AA52EHW3_9PROT|nr:hypothetical protein [Temperatibacter marinus]WND02609.1 hypothetical protein QGN29_13740 [Temperatibacter marinus]
MLETLFFLICSLLILYTVFYALMKDEGQGEWWENYKEPLSDEDEIDP